jgi:predicted homoserine dehydrogenase-like protein
MRSGLFYLLHRPFHITDIIEGIKDPEDIHSIFMRGGNEVVYDIIRIVPVADKVLSTQEHLDWCMGKFCFERSEPVPWIIV